MRVKSLGAVAALIACLAVVVAVPASGDDSTGATSLYVVQLVQAPVATYGGGTAGYAATKPAKGKKMDAGSSAAQSYAGYLNAKHSSALEQVGGADKVYDYTAVFNGFAAQLTDEQASKLELLKDVAVVEKAENVSVDATATTGSSDAFLHLSDNGGLWDSARRCQQGRPEQWGGRGRRLRRRRRRLLAREPRVLGPQGRRLERQQLPAQGDGLLRHLPGG